MVLDDTADASNGPAYFARSSALGDFAELIIRNSALSSAFDDFDVAVRRPLSAWSAAALGGSPVETVFYPFGGPDLCVPLDLFPQAHEYIFVGREACLWENVELALGEPGRVAEVLRHYLACSYFITRDLASNLGHRGDCTLLAMLLAQIVHSGMTPHSVVPIGSTGLQVEFFDHGRLKRLSYYQQDLRDSHWSDLGPVQRHLARRNRIATLFKCASYLPHEPDFSRLLTLVRERATLLVQDPSGVPYADLIAEAWDVTLHGCFTGDIPIFNSYHQPLLLQAYERVASSPLGFAFGYLTDPLRSALMVARHSHRDDASP